MDFPLQLSFKKLALSPQITVTDAGGRLLFYVKQKAFKLKEAVTVFADVEQTRPLYTINADRVLDFSARYHINEMSGFSLGTLQRQGRRSLWRAHYDVLRGGGPVMHIREENPWVRVGDALFSEIPGLGILSGYVFNPAYLVTAAGNGAQLLRVKKEAAFLEGSYSIARTGELSENDERLAVLSVLMMVLLEKHRG
ncbi:MAG TPA: hypothetical protein VGO40_04340 [Longimicrobium sp.]|jgi:hypothetical protein|nr:hypothetical protein [Longimicrobium sp.]